MNNKTHSFDQWKQELIAVTVKETGISELEVKINDASAKEWFDDGFTPYVTFRETWGMENDCSI